jgi:hypothetical protein
MSEPQPIQTKTRPRWGLITFSCLGALILGFLLGALFDSHFRSNYITFEVDRATNRVNVVPHENDVINWVKQTPSHDIPVNVGFISGSPCMESQPNSTCTVKGPGGNYEYICVSAEGVTYRCMDPGVDPQSSTNGTDLESIKVFFKGNPGTSGSAPGAMGAAGPRAMTADNTIVAGIQCFPQGASNAPGVNWEYPPNPADPLPVKVGQTIVWKSGSIEQFTINLPANTCVEQSSGPIDSNNPRCTVLAGTPPSVQYTVNTSMKNACSTNPGNAALQVTP